MLRIAVLVGLLASLSMSSLYAGPVVWLGPDITFTKVDYADSTLAANQDRITGTVWLTRQNTKGLFNIAQETTYTETLYDSPKDTEWAYGDIGDWATLTYGSWVDMSSANPPDMVGQDAVLHLITDDIYLHINFTSWTNGGPDEGQSRGGGFSYDRSTPGTTSGVPEPATYAYMGAGLAALLVTRLRKR